jgi:hypothetical protein
MFRRFLCGVAFAALSVGAASADDLPTVLISTDKAKVTLVFDRALPNVPGKSWPCSSSIPTKRTWS